MFSSDDYAACLVAFKIKTEEPIGTSVVGGEWLLPRTFRGKDLSSAWAVGVMQAIPLCRGRYPIPRGILEVCSEFGQSFQTATITPKQIMEDMLFHVRSKDPIVGASIRNAVVQACHTDPPIMPWRDMEYVHGNLILQAMAATSASRLRHAGARVAREFGCLPVQMTRGDVRLKLLDLFGDWALAHEAMEWLERELSRIKIAYMSTLDYAVPSKVPSASNS